jgi:quercetin dioxygenase-like cupin family protein
MTPGACLHVVKEDLRMCFAKPSLRATLGCIALIVSGAAGAQSTSVSTQPTKDPSIGDPNRIVQILQEPRHRQVHRDGEIYVLDIQINPGDMTLQHTHDAPILYNFISNGKGPAGGRVSSNTEYVEKKFTHQVSNEGPGLFRIIALTNYGPAVANPKTDRPTGVAGEPEVENPWLRAYTLTLSPGESTPLQAHQNPSLVVQVVDGLTHVTREDGMTSELSSMGSWAWRKANSTYQVRNVGTTPVKIVINEARREK